MFVVIMHVNLCTVGGRCGNANTDWSNYCFSCWGCCIGPGCGTGRGQMHIMSHIGVFSRNLQLSLSPSVYETNSSTNARW